MTTDSGNKALAAKLRKAIANGPNNCDVGNIGLVIDALESTPSVLEALEAVSKLPRYEFVSDSYGGHVRKSRDAEFIDRREVLALLKNAQRTASEGSEE